MSIEVMIAPLILDLAVLSRILLETHRQSSVTTCVEKGLLTPVQAAELEEEILDLRKSGYKISQTRGSGLNTPLSIKTSEGYDINVMKNENGAFEVKTCWTGPVSEEKKRKVVQEIENNIKQKYAYEKVRRELAKQGFMISTEEVQQDNTIRLVERKW